jgi:ketosteroid isomerase-like protein
MNKLKILSAFAFLLGMSQTAQSKESSLKLESNPTSVVQRMFEAFGKGDIEGMKKTVSSDTVWTYAGPKALPYAGTYKGPEGVAAFVKNIFTSVDVLDFKVNEFINNGNTVVVTGSEKQKIKKTGRILEQKWVQIYKVNNGLIESMDEYADTAHSSALFKN